MTAAKARKHRELDQSALLGIVGYCVRSADNVLVRWYKQYIRRTTHLREIEFSILTLLDTNDNVTPKQLSQALHLSPPNLAVVIARLEVQGFVERHIAEHDRRSFRIELTKKAVARMAAVREAARAMEADLMRDWSKAERAKLIALLEKLRNSQPPPARARKGDAGSGGGA